MQNDVLSWLVEISKGRELPLEDITLFILFINFVAIHTTTMARKFIFTEGFLSFPLRPLHIRYTTWQLILNMCSLCAKKLKQ